MSKEAIEKPLIFIKKSYSIAASIFLLAYNKLAMEVTKLQRVSQATTSYIFALQGSNKSFIQVVIISSGLMSVIEMLITAFGTERGTLLAFKYSPVYLHMNAESTH